MAKPSGKALEYKTRAQGLSWEALRRLWRQIQDGETPEWDPGRAFEHLVVRGFELSGLRVEYAYDVPPEGAIIEQIDGMVFLGDTPFLIECKDRDSVDFEAVAKMRNQLLRRPPVTMGCVFITGAFTEPALILASFAVPHQITLWSGDDVEVALEARDFKARLVRKYNDLSMYGMTDQSLGFRARR
ncbi:MAG TPA: restriction endonuclease [Isosphaeraceae bacterium]|nr:restriction endonuclease [Isosphaeraceae bacterium]